MKKQVNEEIVLKINDPRTFVKEGSEHHQKLVRKAKKYKNKHDLEHDLILHNIEDFETLDEIEEDEVRRVRVIGEVAILAVILIILASLGVALSAIGNVYTCEEGSLDCSTDFLYQLKRFGGYVLFALFVIGTWVIIYLLMKTVYVHEHNKLIDQHNIGVRVRNNYRRRRLIKLINSDIRAQREVERKIEVEADLKKEHDKEILALIRKREKYWSFIELVRDTILEHEHERVEDLFDKYKVPRRRKNLNRLLISYILKEFGDLENDPRWEDSRIEVKTLRVGQHSTIERPMSFPTFKAKELIEENWPSSTMRKLFVRTFYIFVIFKYTHQDELTLHDAIIWHMPNDDINNYVKPVWEETVEKLKRGDVFFLNKYGKFKSNLPSTKINNIAFISSHARDNDDIDELPVVDRLTGNSTMTRKSFYLSKSYIKSQIDYEHIESSAYGESIHKIKNSIANSEKGKRALAHLDAKHKVKVKETVDATHDHKHKEISVVEGSKLSDKEEIINVKKEDAIHDISDLNEEIYKKSHNPINKLLELLHKPRKTTFVNKSNKGEVMKNEVKNEEALKALKELQNEEVVLSDDDTNEKEEN